MANPEHLEKLREGREAWNAWRDQAGDVPPNLNNANLSKAELRGYNFDGCNFRAADLQDAHIEDVTFVSADLTGAIARGATMLGCNFNYAMLMNANLTHAAIGFTTFHGANLQGADLSGSTFGRNSVTATTLANTRLNDMDYYDDSSIGLDTFFDSGGLPEDFLRGCGVPDEFIAYAGSLTGKSIEYYSCFISYSSKDDEFAHRLHADLQAKKIRTWFAPEDLKIGDRFRTRIDESIRVHDKLVLILSEHSINSAWVQREVETALEREDKEKRDLLFPIQLDAAVFESDAAWARDVCRRHIGDFRNWKSHDDYTKGFDRLVKDLKKEGPIIMKA